jgi:copper chaperone CopZ
MKTPALRDQHMNTSMQRTEPPTQSTTFRVEGMSCGACVRHVTQASEGLPGVVHVGVDLKRHEVLVDHLAEWVGEKRLIEAIILAGYQANVEPRSAAGEVALRPPARRSTGCCCG